MRQKPTGRPSSSEQIIRDIKRKTRKQYGAEEKNGVRALLSHLGKRKRPDSSALVTMVLRHNLLKTGEESGHGLS